MSRSQPRRQSVHRSRRPAAPPPGLLLPAAPAVRPLGPTVLGGTATGEVFHAGPVSHRTPGPALVLGSDGGHGTGLRTFTHPDLALQSTAPRTGEVSAPIVEV
ncbi:hypothetical protein AB0442_05875 [Kitasatospora sp. NPDC085895]|uniref:hypothetical protein n=1 Tax=Kitasatospora sp. NPDC085895 TaxID=3155057 RepID=UPI00344D67D2